jgi:peptidoglycan hydrolase CwlO-like protein
MDLVTENKNIEYTFDGTYITKDVLIIFIFIYLVLKIFIKDKDSTHLQVKDEDYKNLKKKYENLQAKYDRLETSSQENMENFREPKKFVMDFQPEMKTLKIYK